MQIRNTDYETHQDWPSGTFIQGGKQRGYKQDGSFGQIGWFVEVNPATVQTFIRTSGPTIELAETKAWEQLGKILACPKHEYEPRGYVNGSGFCKYCNLFTGDVYTPEQLGCLCSVCAAGTFWYWEGPKENRTFYCREHTPNKAHYDELEQQEPLTQEQLNEILPELLERLAKAAREINSVEP